MSEHSRRSAGKLGQDPKKTFSRWKFQKPNKAFAERCQVAKDSWSVENLMKIVDFGLHAVHGEYSEQNASDAVAWKIVICDSTRL